MNKLKFFLILTFLCIFLVACGDNDIETSEENNLLNNTVTLDNYKKTTTKIQTYFDTSKTKNEDNQKKFTINLICPKSWDFNEGIYSNENGLAMIVHGIIKKIDKNITLDKTAYKYTYRNNDNPNFEDQECIFESNKNKSYVFYKNINYYTGYIVFKFNDEYLLAISIIDCPDEETLYNIIHSVYLQIN